MSKLDELIMELCPNGVEFLPLKAVCCISKGVQFNKSDMLDEGSYPVINGGINPSGYIDQYNQNENTITISQGGASAGYVNWINTKFWAGAHCYVLSPSVKILNRYLFHFTKSKEYVLQECQYGAGIPALAKSAIEDLIIPIPHLEIQHEIVRILDYFTSLTDELTAELISRRTQYEYYSKILLSFQEDVETFRIGDFCQLSAGGDAPKEAFSSFRTNEYLYPIISNGIGEKGLYGYTNIYKINRPCVTVAARGAGVGYVTYRDYPFFPIIRLVTVIPDKRVIPKYLYHVMKRIRFEPTKGGIPQLTVPMIAKYKVPIPSLTIQERIVNILDCFESLCYSPNDGIPAEIHLRRKQYEFYRDYLLSFYEEN